MKKFVKRFFDIKFWRYCFFGFINTIFGIVIYFVAAYVFGANFTIATIVQNVGANSLGYYLNRNYNYKDKQNVFKTATLYATCVGISYIMGYVVLRKMVFLIANWLSSVMANWHLPFDVTSKAVIEDIAMFGCLCIFIIFNYTLQRFLTFGKTERQEYCSYKNIAAKE